MHIEVSYDLELTPTDVINVAEENIKIFEENIKIFKSYIEPLTTIAASDDSHILDASLFIDFGLVHSISNIGVELVKKLLDRNDIILAISPNEFPKRSSLTIRVTKYKGSYILYTE
jgi:hypothetical protein